MRAHVVIRIDEEGDLHVDFAGYRGRACEFEEAELRDLFEELGLEAVVKDRRSKTEDVRCQIREGVSNKKRVRLWR